MTEEEKIQELMKPRFKVVADYPKSPYKIGAIIHIAKRNFGDVSYFKQYPAIFKEIPWYEEKLPEDMPKYVKTKNGNVYRHDYMMEKEMYYNQYIDSHKIGWIEVNKTFADFTPATEAEYKEYLTK